MTETLVTFTAPGSAQDLSRQIEDYARQRQIVSALVVPWESSSDALTMAVTSIHSDGWAIEHTNLGTIQLTSVEPTRTRVAVVAESTDHADREKLADMLQRFAEQLRDTLSATDDSA